MSMKGEKNMQFYSQVPQDILNNISDYKKKREKVKISLPIEYNGNIYYKIIFLKKSLFKTNEETEFIFVNKEGEVVEKINIQKELERLMYYFEIFFDEENEIGILKLLKSDKQLSMEEHNFKDALVGLEYLNKKKIDGIDEVKAIIEKMPELRKTNNNKVKDTIKVIDKLKKEEIVFNEEYLNKIYLNYQEVLKINFRIVKLVKKGMYYYPALKKSIENNRRLYTIILGGKRVNYINKILYVVNYLSKIVSTYSEVLNLTENQYLRYLKQSEKQIINNKVQNIRKLNIK